MPDWDSPFSSALKEGFTRIGKVILLWVTLAFFTSSILLVDALAWNPMGVLTDPASLVVLVSASFQAVVFAWFSLAFSCVFTPLAMAQVVLIGMALIFPERTPKYFLWIAGIQSAMSYIAICWVWESVSPVAGLIIFPFTATWIGIGWWGLHWWGKKQLGDDFEYRREELRQEVERMRSENRQQNEWPSDTEQNTSPPIDSHKNN